MSIASQSTSPRASESVLPEPPPWELPEWQEAVRGNPGLRPFFDNLESFVELPEGAKKLRSLVLGLAVRGKLFKQDERDDPVSELLVECEQQREQLAGEGKLSNRKRLPEVADHEREFVAPAGWQWVRINHICDHRLGKMLDKSKNKGKPYPYLRNTNVQWLEFDLTDVKEMRFEEDELDEYQVHTGDLMVCEGGYPGRCAIWSCATERMMFQKAIHRVRPLGGIESRFLQLRLLYDSDRGHLDQYFTGATIKHFTGKELARYAICLPPLAEQRRIVAKVESLMSLCDTLESYRRERERVREQASRSVLASLTSASAKPPSKQKASGDVPRTETLASAWQRLSDHFEVLLDQPEDVPHLRQAILQLAVQGKLVPQDPADEPASKLIEQIGVKREHLVAEKVINANYNIRDKKLPADELPLGWQWAKFGDITFNRDGDRIPVRKSDREHQKKTYDYYGASGVIDKVENYLFDQPLLLIGEDGANLINRATPIAFIAKGKYWVNNHAHVVDSFSFDMLNYLREFINSINLEAYITGMAQPKMNQARMNSIPVAVPPLAEQKRIVSKVDGLLSKCDELAARLRSRQSTTDALLTALIHQILEGTP